MRENMFLYIAFGVAFAAMFVTPGPAQWAALVLAGGTLAFWVDEKWGQEG